MKGISHFAIGIAAASCLPGAVRAGADGNPLYFILAGVAGLLPDTLDFKFARYFYRHDMEVTPDPNKPDAQMIADAVAYAVNRAREHGRPYTVKLNTIRLGAHEWQPYAVRFDVLRRRVECAVGRGRDAARADAAVVCDVKPDYESTVSVDILDGPVLRMEPLPDGRVAPRFIPWHRQWSHSLVTALLLGLGLAALVSPLAGLVAFAAFGLHILVDQLGFMGSSLWFPFRRARVEGLHRLRSDSAIANLAAVWLSCLLIFWNLAAQRPWLTPGLNPLNLFCFGALLPGALIAVVRRALIRPPTPATLLPRGPEG